MEKKRQHYVSQFLLRYFSVQESNELINFFDHEKDRAVYSAAIRSQAQEKFFYGEDPILEDLLGETEKKAAPVIREMLETGAVPPKEDIRYKRLLRFVMFYAFRTKGAVQRSEDYLNALVKEYAKYNRELAGIDWNECRISHPEPAAFNLAFHMDNWVVGADLEPLLLFNLTGKDFFISDDPLILYNSYMRKRKCYWNADSLLNKGLILLFPLSPKCYLMLYDPCVYDVRVFGEVAAVDKANDVYKLNLLQSVGADRFIYFPDSLNERYVRNMAREGFSRKTDQYVHEKILHPDTKRPALLSYHLPHKIEYYFSFIRDGIEASKYDVHSGIFHPRNEAIVEWVENNGERISKRKEMAE